MAPRPERERSHAKSARTEIDEPAAGSSLAHELELKRLRGEIPCAECKRLKIKCDRQIPCASCVRRGCGQLCPNDHFSTGDGTRFAAAAEEILRRRIRRMLARVRALEDALHNEQALVSDAPHPLLQDGDYTLANDPEDEITAGSKDLQLDAVSDALGTLSIARDGSSRFFGRSAGSTILLTGGAPDAPITLAPPPPVNPDDPSRPATATEETPRRTPDGDLIDGTPDELLLDLRRHLPKREDADKLLLTYYERGTWLVRGPTRLQIMNQLMPAIYAEDGDTRAKAAACVSHSYAGDAGAHAHALLFAVFGVSSLVQSGGPDREAGDAWMRRSQAALVVRSVFDGPSLLTLQALHVLGVLMLMRQDGRDELAWSYQALASHLSITMGLHRDPSRFQLPEDQLEHRRQIFWHLYHLEGWNALNTGRPSIYQQGFIDCQLPATYEMFINGQVIQTPSVMRHSFTFFLRIITHIINITLAARPPRFRAVMDADHLIATFPLAPPGAPPELKQLAVPGTVLYFYVTYPSKESAFICLHRTFFAHALLAATSNKSGADGAGKPESGPHAHSFRRTVDASHGVLEWAISQWDLIPEFCAAAWYMWTYAFAGALVLGSLVIRAPKHDMAPKAFAKFERAVVLFEKAAAAGAGRPQHGLPILQGMLDKAKEALATGIPSHMRATSQAQDSGGNASSGDDPMDETPEDRALRIFGGRTKVVHASDTAGSQARPDTATSATSSNPATTTSAGGSAVSPPFAHAPPPLGSSSQYQTPAYPQHPSYQGQDAVRQVQLEPSRQGQEPTYTPPDAAWPQQQNEQYARAAPPPSEQYGSAYQSSSGSYSQDQTTYAQAQSATHSPDQPSYRHLSSQPSVLPGPIHQSGPHQAPQTTTVFSPTESQPHGYDPQFRNTFTQNPSAVQTPTQAQFSAHAYGHLPPQREEYQRTSIIGSHGQHASNYHVNPARQGASNAYDATTMQHQLGAGGGYSNQAPMHHSQPGPAEGAGLAPQAATQIGSSRSLPTEHYSSSVSPPETSSTAMEYGLGYQSNFNSQPHDYSSHTSSYDHSPQYGQPQHQHAPVFNVPPPSYHTGHSQSPPTHGHDPSQASSGHPGQYGPPPILTTNFAYPQSGDQYGQPAYTHGASSIPHTPIDGMQGEFASIDFRGFVQEGHVSQGQQVYDSAWQPWVSALADPSLGSHGEVPGPDLQHQQHQHAHSQHQPQKYSQEYGGWSHQQ